MSEKNRFPEGWDEARVRDVIDHYDNQTDEEAIAEDEVAFGSKTSMFIEVPIELVPTVRDLIAKHQIKGQASE